MTLWGDNMKFESKYDTEALVEYKGKGQQQDDGGNVFGKITAVTFWKSDAVNHACSYDIQRVNGDTVDKGVSEHDVVKVYKDFSNGK